MEKLTAVIDWIKANKVKVSVVAGAVVTAITASAPEHTIAYKAAAALGKFLVQLAASAQ